MGSYNVGYDLEKIKLEYLATKISLRKLCEKHQVPFSTISKKAADEKWLEQRKQIESKAETKAINKIVRQKAKTMEEDYYTLENANAQIIELVFEAIEQVRQYIVTSSYRTQDKAIIPIIVDGFEVNSERITIEDRKEINTITSIIDVDKLLKLATILKNLGDNTIIKPQELALKQARLEHQRDIDLVKYS